jgi:hypothetical protein
MGQQNQMNGTGATVRAAVLAFLAVGMTVASGFLMVQWLVPAAPPVPPATEPAVGKPAELFRTWPANRKPDLVLLLSGQMHGYLQPCGCSSPQLGGLARRYNLMQSLRGRGWPLVAVDLGDLPDPPEHRGPQTLLKYKKSMEALKLMNYLGVGVGQYETAAPTLLDMLAEYAINDPDPPVLFSNLMNKQNAFANAVQSWVVSGSQNGAPKVGVVAIVGPTIFKEIPQQNPAVQVAPTQKVLGDALKDMQSKKPELLVLLYQGTAEEARSCAKAFPEFHVILCQTRESEPPAKPERVGDTLIVSVGHKGRYVGLVGMFRNNGNAGNRPFELQYELAALGEEFETPKGAPPNPVMKMMEDYAMEVKTGGYLSKYPQRKHVIQVAFANAEYVGSERCKKCHQTVYKAWQDTPHFHAYQELVKADRPKQRQFDGECIQCHVVGFGFNSGFTDEKATKHLTDVGCESCHGPGSLHVKGNNKPELMTLMNPFKVQPGETQEAMNKRLNLLDQSCQKCHDIDNDVHWDFRKKWPRIVHPDPTLPTPTLRGKDPFTVPQTGKGAAQVDPGKIPFTASLGGLRFFSGRTRSR